jgi:glutathione peroxidase
MSQFYQFTALNNLDKEIRMEEYKGKVVLVVNTASKCGFTQQYAQLQELYRKYKDQGLIILAFPCNQFANQEPASDSEIAEFCQLNFGVSFPIFSKVEVNGANAHPLFNYLKKQTKSLFGSKIKWNFTKFLIDREGKVIKRFAPNIEPFKIEKDLQALL